MKELTSYGDWALIFGATDGLGKAFSKHFAQQGVNIAMIGRRKEKLEGLAEEFHGMYGVDTKVIPQDLTAEDAIDSILSATKDIDIGIVCYIATSYQMGKFHEMENADLQRVLQINVLNYTKFLRHFTEAFHKRNRGAIITLSSLTAITGSPYNAIYGATKSFELILTEAVAYELKNSNVDVLVSTLSSTRTPDWSANQPQGDIDNSTAQTPEDVVCETMNKLGSARSCFPGQIVEESYRSMVSMTRDDATQIMGSYYEKQYD